MTALRRRRRDDRHLRGVAPKTQPGDREAVTHLAQDDQRAPAQLRAAESRPSCRDLLHAKQVAAST
jgi:hypothetical protein